MSNARSLAAAELKTLDDLCVAMKNNERSILDRFGQWSSSLPTFGGEEPADTQEVWSWDETRLLVGTCASDLEIVDRPTKRSLAAAEMGKAKSKRKADAARENAQKGGRPRTKTATKFHRDGSVTYWSVYEQVWKERVFFVPDNELAAMPGQERERVIRHIEQSQ